MRITQATAEKDPNTGRNKILVEIDQTDIKIIRDALRMINERHLFDPDDSDYQNKFNHVNEVTHQAKILLWPS